MKPRVLEIISTLGDGGAEALVKDYARMLNIQDVETEILTVYKVTGSSNLKQAQEANIRVTSIFPDNSRLSKLIKQTLGFIYVPYKILFFIKKNNISCVHIHMNQLHHITPIMYFLKNIRVLYTCHNDPQKYFRGVSGRMEFRAVRTMVKYDNFKLIALHKEMADKLACMFNTRNIEVIRNGVDFKRYANLPISRKEKRKELGIDDEAFVIGHVGRFSEQKNHTFLVDIFSNLAKINEKAFLLLVGSGNLQQEIEEKLKVLKLEGRYLVLSHRTDVPELLSIMNVFLFPSLYEGLPVSLVEAQVAKLHCVVSDTINKSAILLPSTTVLSLDTPIERWSEECLRIWPEIEWNEDLRAYDMNNEILRLKSLCVE